MGLKLGVGKDIAKAAACRSRYNYCSHRAAGSKRHPDELVLHAFICPDYSYI